MIEIVNHMRAYEEEIAYQRLVHNILISMTDGLSMSIMHITDVRALSYMHMSND